MAGAQAVNEQLLIALQRHLPASSVLLDEDSLASYSADWSGTSPVTPPCVLRPDSTEQVSTILRLCNEHRQPVVTQGGLTGLSGGATPQAGEIALSLERLQGVSELDRKGQYLIVKAGTVLQHVQEAARDAGFKLALDLGARGQCSIGGNLSTNAGGNQVIKYGMAREQVLGLEAVLANGSIVRSMNTLLKNNAGYDLKHFFIGTEGTLGVLTECALRLRPLPKGRATALCACPSFDSALAILQHTQAVFGALSSFELMWQHYFEHASERAGHKPFQTQHNYVALLEVESDGSEHAQEQFLQTLSADLEAGIISDAIIAQSEQEAQEFWAIRDAIAEILRDLTPLANFDIGIPIKHMESFVDQVRDELNQRYPGLILLVFGHIGDGNLHLVAATGQEADVEPIHELVFQRTAQFGGTITAEHGVGTHKKEHLHLIRSDAELAMMRSLKQALDPNNILNPGRIFNA